MSKIKLLIWLAVAGMSCTIWIQQKRITTIKSERDRHQNNSEAMLSDLQQWRVDSTTMATDVKSLRFTIDEMERYRAKDAELIEQLGVKIKDLEAMAKHQIEVSAPIDAVVRDTVIIRDTVPIVAQSVIMQNPHISLNGVIENNNLTGDVILPVTLRQAVWIEYKRRWLFWRKATAVHQTISSDNPYVKINYSEYVEVQR